MRSGLLAMILLVTIGFASQVVSFDNNWGKNHMFNIVSSTTNGMDIVFSMHSMVIEDIMVHGVLMNTYGIPGVFLPNDEGAPNVEGTGRQN
jgi:hypothetical protein